MTDDACGFLFTISTAYRWAAAATHVATYHAEHITGLLEGSFCRLRAALLIYAILVDCLIEMS